MNASRLHIQVALALAGRLCVWGLLCLALNLCGFRLFAAELEVKVGVLSRYGLTSVVLQGAGLQVWGEGIQGESRFLEAPRDSVALRAVGNGVAVGGNVPFRKLRVRSTAGRISVTDGKVLFGRFGGELRVEARDGRLGFVESLPLEAYVRRVLASEMSEDFPMEAQKAQAVLIRSYALAHRGRHAAEGFDFCDLTHCQTYGGLAAESGIRDEALRATRSLVMSHGGKPIEGLFHSTCGGHTSANQRVFGGRPLPYLQGVDDRDYCAASPHSVWSGRIPLEKISAALALDDRLRASIPLHGLAAGDREPGGRVFSMRLPGPRSGEIATMEFLSRVGKALGWNLVKSNWFDVVVEGGVAVFHGRGLGHGVGLCQWGARGMALSGSRFDEILRHYFPGAQLRRLP